MLTQAENETLMHVGRGTPLGELMRRYWVPAMLSSELAEPNGDPKRLRLLGDNLVAWRDASGTVGIFDENCMHRGASLALGRCEGDGLRCIYHGWKFATDGSILDTPNYAQSRVRDKLRAPVYPVHEAGEIIWVYLGPPEKEPAFPRFKFTEVPQDQRAMYHVTLDCHFLQVVEGNLDPTHIPVLHQDHAKNFHAVIKNSDGSTTTTNFGGYHRDYTVLDSHPSTFDLEDTAQGSYGCFFFGAEASGLPTNYFRIYGFALPYLCFQPMGNMVIDVPIDDTHTSFFQIGFSQTEKVDRELYVNYERGPLSHYKDGLRWRYGPDQNWGQDRSAMTEGKSFSGVTEGVVAEDYPVWTSMGSYYDRRDESLAPADHLLVRMRRNMLKAAADLQKGIDPVTIPADVAYGIRLGQGILDDPKAWREHIPSADEARVTPAG
jgi:phthalate 4,5-dioxygenase oxygenase subunit